MSSLIHSSSHSPSTVPFFMCHSAAMLEHYFVLAHSSHTHTRTHTRAHTCTHAHTDTHARACAHTTCLNAHYYTCPTTSHVFPCSVVHSCTQPCLLLLNSMDVPLLSLLQIESTLMRTSHQATALLCLDTACPHPSPGATSVWGYRLVGGGGYCGGRCAKLQPNAGPYYR